MSNHESVICRNCGKVMEQKLRKQHKNYCNDECRNAYYYQMHKEGKLIGSCEYKCEYCGKYFVADGKKERKYCSNACNGRARFAKREQTAEEWSEFREKALELRRTGMLIKKISAELGISLGTVGSWVSVKKSKRQTLITSLVDECTENQMDKSDTAPEEDAIIENDHNRIEVSLLKKESEIRRIFLMCGTTKFQGKIDHFANQIPRALDICLISGDVFVFCSRQLRQISVLQWQGDGFALMFRRTEHERYPWPKNESMKVIEITRMDLDMMLEYPRFMQRLSGNKIPQIV